MDIKRNDDHDCQPTPTPRQSLTSSNTIGTTVPVLSRNIATENDVGTLQIIAQRGPSEKGPPHDNINVSLGTLNHLYFCWSAFRGVTRFKNVILAVMWGSEIRPFKIQIKIRTLEGRISNGPCVVGFQMVPTIPKPENGRFSLGRFIYK